MTDFGKKGKKNLIEINIYMFLTYPWWPFPKEVFQRTSYMKIGKIKKCCFVITLHVLNTTKMLRLPPFLAHVF